MKNMRRLGAYLAIIGLSFVICLAVFYMSGKSDVEQRFPGSVCTAQNLYFDQKQLTGGLPLKATVYYNDGLNDCGNTSRDNVKQNFKFFFESPLFYVNWFVDVAVLSGLFYVIGARRAHSRD